MRRHCWQEAALRILDKRSVLGQGESESRVAEIAMMRATTKSRALDSGAYPRDGTERPP